MHKCMYRRVYIHIYVCIDVYRRPPPLRKYRGEGGVSTKANLRTVRCL